MTLDVATVVAATGAQVLEIGADGRVEAVALSPADLERPIATVSIDSRAVTPGSLFVALQGERVDGHRFVPDALRAGACACLVAAALAGPLPAASRAAGRRYLFVVPDPLPALQQLAAYWRRRHEVEVVGITGSIGKTTTKEIVASLLAARWPVLRSQANLNTEIGLPLMLLRLGPEHRLAVLEMGMYAPGDIALLAEIARPRVGLVTNVAPIHLERMRSIERIARAKSELIAALPPDGLAVLNGDDPWTRAMALTSGLAASLLVGFARDCAYRAGQVTPRGLEGVSFTLEAEGRKLPFRTQVAGVHTLHAFLMAAAVGRARGMTWEEIREAA
ncbi:MAG: UDP-N-acetylmuramoyl-tripeptide--D-alanyl-D-alanine ligase, partial [Chloroflexi bacterium]|nr:UDP-N-acetylmuramoyl-tripeptide--D-alanyl-D-alanine ligase [Chloroflexota bacterium]